MTSVCGWCLAIVGRASVGCWVVQVGCRSYLVCRGCQHWAQVVFGWQCRARQHVACGLPGARLHAREGSTHPRPAVVDVYASVPWLELGVWLPGEDVDLQGIGVGMDGGRWGGLVGVPREMRCGRLAVVGGSRGSCD